MSDFPIPTTMSRDRNGRVSFTFDDDAARGLRFKLTYNYDDQQHPSALGFRLKTVRKGGTKVSKDGVLRIYPSNRGGYEPWEKVTLPRV